MLFVECFSAADEDGGESALTAPVSATVGGKVLKAQRESMKNKGTDKKKKRCSSNSKHSTVWVFVLISSQGSTTSRGKRRRQQERMKLRFHDNFSQKKSEIY